MILKTLTCPSCDLRLGGYDRRAGTLVLDVAAYPTIAFFIDAPASPATTAEEAPRSTVTIACPSCGCCSSLKAVSVRFGKKKGDEHDPLATQ